MNDKWTPEVIICCCRRVIVNSVVSHPPGTHPDSPIKKDMTAVELRTVMCSRWFGCDKAYIDSHLRMRVVGLGASEIYNSWPDAKD